MPGVSGLILPLSNSLMGRSVQASSLRMKETEQLTVLEVVRDLASITMAELRLIVQLVRDYYGKA